MNGEREGKEETEVGDISWELGTKVCVEGTGDKRLTVSQDGRAPILNATKSVQQMSPEYRLHRTLHELCWLWAHKDE